MAAKEIQPFRLMGYAFMSPDTKSVHDPEPENSERGFVLFPLDSRTIVPVPMPDGPLIQSTRDWLEYGFGPVVIVCIAQDQHEPGVLFHADARNLLSFEQLNQVQHTLEVARVIGDALRPNRGLQVAEVLDTIEAKFGVRPICRNEAHLQKPKRGGLPQSAGGDR